MAEPLDFELEIGPAAEAGYPVTARAKGRGEASGTMSWSLAGPQLEIQLAAIRDSVLASSATVRRLSTLDEQPVREFGQSLFDAAITDDIRLLYGAAYQESRQQDRPLRLILRVRPPELARLPWEYLFDRSDDSYLGLRMPLVRYPQVLEPQRPLKVSPPLNILAMVARPTDQVALDVRSEKRRLETAVAELERAGQVKLTWVHGQSWRHLRATLDSGAWHVFHFIGHGGFDAASGEGVLALAGENGGTAPLGAGAISMVLSENSPLRLVVLNACDTGRSSSLDSFSSVAGALVRRGIPAILAMQFEITDRAAIEFTRTFYEELAHRRPVDACAMRARQAIYIAQTNSLEWGTPVLYLRSTDGQIFDFSETDTGDSLRVQRYGRSDESASLGERYEEGLAAFHTERWEDAVGAFRQLLAKQPDYPGASLKLQQALKQARLVAGYREAAEAASETRWKEAVDGFEAVLAVDPGYRDASKRLEEARTEQTIAELQDEARRLYGAQHYEAVVRIGEQLRIIDDQRADPDGMVTEAQRSLAAAQSAEQQAEHYTRALEHLDRGDWQAARAALERVEQLGYGYRNTEELRAMVDGRLAPPQSTSSAPHRDAVVVTPDQAGGAAAERAPAPAHGAQFPVIRVMGQIFRHTRLASRREAGADAISGYTQTRRRRTYIAFAAGFAIVVVTILLALVDYNQKHRTYRTSGSCSTCPELADKPGQVVFADDFTSDKGWDRSTYQLHVGQPFGTVRMSQAKGDRVVVEGLTPLTTSYDRIKIEAKFAAVSGDGTFGLACHDPRGTSYDFTGFAGGSDYYITGPPVTDDSYVSANARGPAMNLRESHTLTAICFSDAGSTNLELLVDGQTVVKARVTGHTGRWRPQVYLSSGSADIDVDLSQFTVSTLS